MGLPGADDQPVDKPAPQEHAAQGHEQRLRIVGRAPRFDADERQSRSEDVDVGDRDRQTEQEMQEDPPGELLVGRWQELVRGDDERRDQPPRPPLRERAEEGPAPVAARSHTGQRKHEADSRPGDEGKDRPPNPCPEPRVGTRGAHRRARRIPSRSSRRRIKPHP